MKLFIAVLVCSLSVLSACHQDESPEQQEKELQYWESCESDHLADGNFAACQKPFEKKFGHPYKVPGSDSE